MPPVCCWCLLQVYGPSSSCVSGERCGLHPPLWVQTLSGCQQYPQWRGQCCPPCGLCEINFFFQASQISDLWRICSSESTHKHLPLSPFQNSYICRLCWCPATPPWRCSMQGTQPLTTGSRPMSDIAATKGQRVWPARWWVTPVLS